MNELNGYDIEDLSVDMTATFSKTITEADIVLFAGVSGDNNALHITKSLPLPPHSAGVWHTAF